MLPNPFHRQTLGLALALILPIASAIPVAPAFAREPAVYTQGEKLAVSGYDAVAYFKVGKPVKGDGAYTADYNGVVWRFASAANRDAFKAAPQSYAPQFGGYCAWAVSQGYTASADPQAWKIVDGKLYLNYSRDVAVTWSKDIPGNIAKGNANWPKVLDK